MFIIHIGKHNVHEVTYMSFIVHIQVQVALQTTDTHNVPHTVVYVRPIISPQHQNYCGKVMSVYISILELLWTGDTVS